MPDASALNSLEFGCSPKSNLPSPTPLCRQRQIAGLLADAIINLHALSRVSCGDNETFSETRQRLLDSCANSGLCVTTPNVSVRDHQNQESTNEA